MLVVRFKSLFENIGLDFSGFVSTGVSSTCLCSALSPAGPKDLFTLQRKLLAPMLSLGRSSEECFPLMPSESAPCCADKPVPYRNTISSFRERMASFQNLKQAASRCQLEQTACCSAKPTAVRRHSRVTTL